MKEGESPGTSLPPRVPSLHLLETVAIRDGDPPREEGRDQMGTNTCSSYDRVDSVGTVQNFTWTNSFVSFCVGEVEESDTI